MPLEENTNEEIAEESKPVKVDKTAETSVEEAQPVEKAVDNNTDKLKNLLALGISQETLTGLMNQGLTMDEINDFCNNEINDKLDTVMKKVMTIFSEIYQEYKFFSFVEADVNRNKEIHDEAFEAISKELLENDIMYKNVDMIFKTIVDRMFSTFENAKTNYSKSKDELFAKMMGKELIGDISLQDIDKKHKELATPKTEDNS